MKNDLKSFKQQFKTIEKRTRKTINGNENLLHKKNVLFRKVLCKISCFQSY